MIDALEVSLAEADDLALTSPTCNDGRLPDWTGYVNANQNPELVVEGVPDDAESLVVTAVHLEAAEVVDHPWIHWLVWDVAPDVGVVPRDWDAEAAGATEGYNDFLKRGWGGPSPPVGQTETYRFRMYALDTELNLPPQTRRARLASTIGLEAEVLAATELTGRYDAEQGTVFATEGPLGLRP